MSFYFIYRITQGATELVKNLEKISRLDTFKEAKQQVRSLRSESGDLQTSIYKIIFAESELDAEEKLQAKREAPIIREWEK